MTILGIWHLVISSKRKEPSTNVEKKKGNPEGWGTVTKEMKKRVGKLSWGKIPKQREPSSAPKTKRLSYSRGLPQAPDKNAVVIIWALDRKDKRKPTIAKELLAEGKVLISRGKGEGSKKLVGNTSFTRTGTTREQVRGGDAEQQEKSKTRNGQAEIWYDGVVVAPKKKR